MKLLWRGVKLSRILFISEIQDPVKQGSSTQIMTRNILEGLKENNEKVLFIAITDRDCDDESVIKHYSELVEEIIIVKSQLELRYTKGSVKRLIKTIKHTYKYKVDKSLLDGIKCLKGDLIITHSPSIESILIANAIKQKFPSNMYIQYWSDPLAISGIYPEDLNFKRYLYLLIEKRLLLSADNIVYGTKTLYEHQKEIYTKFKKRMSYIDVAYQSNVIEKIQPKSNKPLVGYTGQFNTKNRNILPLYNVFNDFEEADLLICGNGDVPLLEKDNIKVLNKRFSQNQIKKVENEIDIMVGILNSNCIQIPGKIFYHTHTDKVILVILDGRYSDQIYNYLKKFERFEFCDNNEESIRIKLKKILREKKNVNKENIFKLSPKEVSKKLIEGGY